MNTSQGTDFVWSPISVTSSAANLNNFVGTGNIATNSFSSYLTVNWSSGTVGAGAFSGTSLTQHADLVSSESIAYTYLKHANASFSSAGDVNQLSGSGLSFSVFNLGDANTTKLDFAGTIECIGGNCSAFNVSMPTFQDLAAGSSKTGGLGLLSAAAPGAYEATYRPCFLR